MAGADLDRLSRAERLSFSSPASLVGIHGNGVLRRPGVMVMKIRSGGHLNEDDSIS